MMVQMSVYDIATYQHETENGDHGSPLTITINNQMMNITDIATYQHQ